MRRCFASGSGTACRSARRGLARQSGSGSAAATRRGGWSLVELLTYIAVFAVVSAGAYRALHETFTHSRNLQRNADDIIAAVRAGERWRTDIRQATGPVVWRDDRLTIPQQSGSVEYRFSMGVVWRTVDGKDTPVLRTVKASRMQTEERQHVTAWLWEVELVTASKAARVSQLFSFAAVAGKGKP